MWRRLAHLIVTPMLTISLLDLGAVAQTSGLAAELVASGVSPLGGTGVTAIAQPPGDSTRLFATARVGRIRIVKDGVLLPTPFLDLTSKITTVGEGGLTALVFDPNYEVNRRFYVHYSSPGVGAGVVSWIVAYQTSATSPDLADPTPVKVLLRMDRLSAIHVLGFLAFHPHDGMMYIGLGESGYPAMSQNLNELTGKILRINPEGDDFPDDPDRNYSIPPDNPLVGLEGDDEIWAWGLRNPWQGSFDRLTGDLWLPDVGEAAYEEIDFAPAKRGPLVNYGWGCLEGPQCHLSYTYCRCDDPDLEPPLFSYAHPVGCAVIGGRVYRGCDIPGLRGAYLFTDWCSLGIYYLVLQDGVITELHHPEPALAMGAFFPFCFGEDNQGELYVGTQTGFVFKIITATPPLDSNGNGISDSCEADLNGDGQVNGFDLALLLGQWGPCGVRCSADFNGDDVVNGCDLALLLGAWGPARRAAIPRGGAEDLTPWPRARGSKDPCRHRDS